MSRANLTPTPHVNLSADPTSPSPVEGDIYYSTGVTALRAYANSSWQTLGLLRTAGVNIPKFLSGRWYTFPHTSIATNAPAISALRAVPFYVPVKASFDRIACEVTTVGSSGAVVRLGLYNSDSSGNPSSLIVDAGTVDAATSTGVKELTINQTLNSGLYYLALSTQVASSTIRVTSNTTFLPPVASTSFNTTTTLSHFIMNSVTGAFPSTFTIDSFGATTPRIQLRAA